MRILVRDFEIAGEADADDENRPGQKNAVPRISEELAGLQTRCEKKTQFWSAQITGYVEAMTARMLRITLHIRPPATCREVQNLG
jgi:hypothetical protein